MFGCIVLKLANPNERDLDKELVQTVLTTKYHDPNADVSPSGDACEGSQFEYLEFWGISNEKSHESSTRLKVEDFLKLPRVKITIDPLLWWFMIGFKLYCIMFY